jgi:hypothetical protein
MEDAAGRLSRPVIQAEAGLWVVIAAGVGAAEELRSLDPGRQESPAIREREDPSLLTPG